MLSSIIAAPINVAPKREDFLLPTGRETEGVAALTSRLNNAAGGKKTTLNARFRRNKNVVFD